MHWELGVYRFATGNDTSTYVHSFNLQEGLNINNLTS